MNPRIDTLLQRWLWNSRLIMLVAVVSSLVLALGAFYMATVDVLYLFSRLAIYADFSLTGDARAAVRADLVTYIVKTMDSYLIAAILLLFALGLYELFVGKIRQAEGTETPPGLLKVQDLDDLKDRVVKLILLVLAIEFFQRALKLTYKAPVDLFFLALGILLVSGSFYISSLKAKPRDPE